MKTIISVDKKKAFTNSSQDNTLEEKGISLSKSAIKRCLHQVYTHFKAWRKSLVTLKKTSKSSYTVLNQVLTLTSITRPIPVKFVKCINLRNFRNYTTKMSKDLLSNHQNRTIFSEGKCLSAYYSSWWVCYFCVTDVLELYQLREFYLQFLQKRLRSHVHRKLIWFDLLKIFHKKLFWGSDHSSFLITNFLMTFFSWLLFSCLFLCSSIQRLKCPLL